LLVAIIHFLSINCGYPRIWIALHETLILFIGNSSINGLHSWNTIIFILSWQLKFLPLQHLSNVKIEEITVENGLNTTCYDGDDVIETLSVVPVHPVEDVEGSVGSKSEQIVAGDALRLPSLGHHEQLGQDSNRFQIDGESPQDFHN